MIAGQLAGLVASIAAYLAGVWLFLRAQAKRIRTLPPEWRDHPELREVYDAALALTLRSSLTSQPRRSVMWLAAFVFVFFLVAAANVRISAELICVALFASVVTGGELQRSKDEAARLVPRVGKERPAGDRLHLARWGARFLAWAGYLGTACFVGGLLATPFR
jgi:hypothetical protein